jgi:hypothetical protein
MVTLAVYDDQEGEHIWTLKIYKEGLVFRSTWTFYNIKASIYSTTHPDHPSTSETLKLSKYLFFNMQLSTILTAFLAGASVTMAIPAMIRQATPVCTGTDSNAQCCATDVLGVADLNCATRKLSISTTQYRL